VTKESAKPCVAEFASPVALTVSPFCARTLPQPQRSFAALAPPSHLPPSLYHPDADIRRSGFDKHYPTGAPSCGSEHFVSFLRNVPSGCDISSEFRDCSIIHRTYSLSRPLDLRTTSPQYSPPERHTRTWESYRLIARKRDRVRYGHLRLPKRATSRTAPSVSVIIGPCHATAAILTPRTTACRSNLHHSHSHHITAEPRHRMNSTQ
jgi:hypothetical protein